MALLPSANTSLNDQAGAFAGGTGYLVAMGCVGQNADLTPRVFASSAAMLSQHGYAQGVDYCAIHFAETNKPVIYVGLPVVTAGAVGRQNNLGVTGTCQITITADAHGILEETNASLVVQSGGAVGTNGIMFNLSMDGGFTTKLIRLGTATSYTVPFLGVVINFAAGTLVAGDTFTFSTTAPMWDNAGLTAAWAALAAQMNLARSVMEIGDLSNSTLATDVTTQANTYATASERFTFARAQVSDFLPLATQAQVLKTMSGTPTLAFAASGETLTRSTGSFLTDGFVVGDTITVPGSVSNTGTYVITTLTATVATCSAATFVNEGPTVLPAHGSCSIAFASGSETITRAYGSWVADGFAVGQTTKIAGSASNNGNVVITTLTPTVMTCSAATLVAEVASAASITLTNTETMSAFVSSQATAFAIIDAQDRIDIGIGRGRKVSPITGWEFRRPAQWFVSIREYQHDLQIPTWRKADGPLDGVSLEDVDGNGNVVEYDERTVGGALAARFTCLRTFGNGPRGAFVALSLTRATEGSLLSRTHNMAVANLVCNVTQAETENAIGQVLILNSDGTGTTASLERLAQRVNSALQVAVLQAGPEGPLASACTWVPSKTDVLNVPGARLNGVTNLLINGTLEQISTSVLVQAAG